jgi:hypothetical protein
MLQKHLLPMRGFVRNYLPPWLGAGALAVLVAISCENPAAPEIARIELGPAQINFTALGDTTRVTAQVFDAHDRIMNFAVEYESADPAIATVDKLTGIITAIDGGSTVVRAQAKELVASVRVTVTQVVHRMVLTPSFDSLFSLTDTSRFKAVIEDRLGHTVKNARVFWSTSNPAVATIDTAGLATAVSNGFVIVTGTFGQHTASASLLTEQKADSVALAPSSVSVQQNATAVLIPTVLDAKRQTIDPKRLVAAWTSANPATATVTQDGVVRGQAAGSTDVTVGFGTLSRSAVVTVEPIPEPPPGSHPVKGSVVIPTSIDSARVYVSTVHASSAVGSGGSFQLPTSDSVPTMVFAMQAGDVPFAVAINAPAVAPSQVNLAVSAESGLRLDTRSTAVTLVFLSPVLAGLPRGLVPQLLALIDSLPETSTLTQRIDEAVASTGKLPDRSNAAFLMALKKAIEATYAAIAKRVGLQTPDALLNAMAHAQLAASGINIQLPDAISPTLRLSLQNAFARDVDVYRIYADDDGRPLAGQGASALAVELLPADYFPDIFSWSELKGLFQGEYGARPPEPYEIGFSPANPRQLLFGYGIGNRNLLREMLTILGDNDGKRLIAPVASTVLFGMLLPPMEFVVGFDLIPRLNKEKYRASRAYVKGVVEGTSLMDCVRTGEDKDLGPCVGERILSEVFGVEDAMVGLLLTLSELSGKKITLTVAKAAVKKFAFVVSAIETLGDLASVKFAIDNSTLREEFDFSYNRLLGVSSLALLSGNHQVSVADTKLAAPLVVRTVDTKGDAVAGAWIAWTTASGNGVLSQALDTTDANGESSVTWTTGATPSPRATARLLGENTRIEFAADVPAEPTGLTAVPVSGSRIDLSWQDKANNEDEYRVERAPSGTAAFELIATLPRDAEAYKNEKLPSGTAFDYRVRATAGTRLSEFSNIASGATPTVPVASDLKVTASTQSITIGESFDVTISGANSGTATSTDGRLIVSFPALSAVGDKARVVSQAATSSDLEITATEKGQSITRIAGGTPIEAQYLIADARDVEWAAGEVDTLVLRVTPKAAGSFEVYARLDLRVSETERSRDPSTGETRDQQDGLVRVATVTVRAAAPMASDLSVKPAKSTINLGESVDVIVSGRNGGTGPGVQGFLSVSFPGLTATGDRVRVEVRPETSSDVKVTAYEKDASIFPVDGSTAVAAAYLLEDGVDSSWEADETNTMVLRVTPKVAGTFTVYARMALQISADVYSRDPSSGDKDQQGGFVAVAAITVKGTEPIASGLTVVASKTTIVLGETVDVTVSGKNTGKAASTAGYLSVSFPNLDAVGDKKRVEKLSGTSGDVVVTAYEKGESIFPVDGTESVKASYLLEDGLDNSWEPDESNSLVLRVEPRVTGTFTIYARMALLVSGSTYSRDPQSGEKDQQNGFVAVATVTVVPPEPVAGELTIAASSETITLGESVDVTVTGKNLGSTVSSAGYLSVSFPALTGVGDKGRVIVTSTTSSDLTVTAYEKDQMIFPVDGTQQIKAQYLLEDALDGTWEVGETNTLVLRATPRSAGTFAVYARMALLVSGTRYSRDPTSGTQDQQGGFVRVANIIVKPKEPTAAELKVSPSKQSITIGDSFVLTVSGKNVGTASSSEGYVSVSFPALTKVGDKNLVTVTNGNSSDLTVTPYEKDQLIYPVNSTQQMKARYLLEDGVDTDWQVNETNTMELLVTPREVGTFTIYARMALFVSGTNYSRDPTSGGAHDQQNGYVAVATVQVKASEPTAGELTVSPTTATITLGQTIDVTITGKNVGTRASGDGYISVSFPQLAAAGDKSRVTVLTTTSSDLFVTAYEKGSKIYPVDGTQQMTALYLLEDGQDSNWEVGEVNKMVLRVKPKVVGKFEIYARMALFDSGTTWSRDPTSGTRDQQGGYVKVGTITVK